MALRSGVWAILFTDVVGSTEQRARLGDHAGDALRHEHDAIVARVLARYRGERVEGTGDGAMCAFASAADAVAAGVALQQRVDRRNQQAAEPLALRVGVSLGEFAYDDSGLMGLAAHEAARICALCDAGQVLVSDLARTVAGPRTDCEFTSRGDIELKGLSGPVTVWEVARAPEAEVEAMPLPSLLAPTEAVAFSGREAELDRVLQLWRRAVGGSRQASFVVGEPGIGKTRLAAEAARVAHGEGAIVLYGRCDDEASVPFQPFAEILDWYLERADEAIVGRYPGDLARLSPRVTERAPDHPDALSADPASEQHRLFDAVASWIASLADEQPVVLVLDDLHWATKPTLLMLRHLVRAADARLFVIGTYRDTDLDDAHPLHALLPEFNRLHVDRLGLSGLDQAGVVGLLERTGEQEASDEMRAFASSLIDETEGNPFFIGEVLRHLIEAGTLVHGESGWTSGVRIDELGIPRGVTEVLHERLQRLGTDAARVLQVAAVVGRDFAIDVVAAAADTTEDATLEALEAALVARLVEETGPDEYRFAHALVRAALEDEVSASRRARLHRRIGEHLEVHHPDDIAGLANHWLEAAAAGEIGKAVDYAVQAGDHAVAQLAPDEAVSWYARAVDLLDRVPGADKKTLLAALEHLGGAQVVIGDPDEYHPTWRRAAELALELDDPIAYARAMVGYVGRAETLMGLDDYARAGIEASLSTLPDPERELRVRLTGSLASGITNFEPERATDLSVTALQLARQVGKPDLVANAISSRLRCWWDPLANEDRLALTEEMRAIAIDSGDADLLANSWQWSSILALERGDLGGTVEAADGVEQANERLGLTYYQWSATSRRAAVALCRGALDDAERLMSEALALERHGFSVFATQFAALRWLQGREEEVDIGGITLDYETGANRHVIRGAQLLLAAEVGELANARALLAEVADDIDDLARYQLCASVIGCVAARAAVAVGPGPWVEPLLALLAPLENTFAVLNPAAGSFGCVAGALGLLFAIAGDDARAEVLLRRAVERNRAAGLQPFVALVLADLAEVLAERSPAEAAAVAAEATELATRMGMQRVAERAGKVGS